MACVFCARAKVGYCKKHVPGSAAVGEVAASATVPPSVSLSDILGAIQSLGADFAEVRERVSKLESREPAPGPTYVPMQAPLGPERPVTAGQAWAGLDGRPGNDARTGSSLLEYRSVDDQPVPFGPKYQVGMRVRLKREVEHGTGVARKVRLKDEDGIPVVDEEGRPVYTREIRLLPWGEVLDKLGQRRCQRDLGRGKRCGAVYTPNEACPRCGEGPTVRKVYWTTKDGVWKYSVRVPGLSQKQGQDVLEYELEHAG